MSEVFVFVAWQAGPLLKMESFECALGTVGCGICMQINWLFPFGVCE